MRRLIYTGLSVALIGIIHVVWAQPNILGKTKFDRKVVRKTIPFEVKYLMNRDLGRGRLKKVVDGKPGEERTIVTEVITDGKVVKEFKRVEKTPAQTAVIHMGSTGFQGARGGSFTRSKVMVMNASAYTPDAGRGASATFRTATGRKAQYGVVAVDPKVIPLNTLVFVEGYGFALACDTGGAIKGNRIDLCMAQRDAAMKFGRRKVTVHVFKGRHK